MGNSFTFLMGAFFLSVCSGPVQAMGPTATEWQDCLTDAAACSGVADKLNAVHGQSRPNGGTVTTTNVWAVGDNGRILRYDGFTWSTFAPPVGAVGVDLYDVYILPSADLANDVLGWAAGAGGTLLRLTTAGAWVCVSCPNGACGPGGGDTLEICADLHDIFPVDANDPNSTLVIVGAAQCNPPDPGPYPGPGGGNPTVLMWNATAGTWKRITTAGPGYKFGNMAGWQVKYLCDDCCLPFPACIPERDRAVMYTGLITDSTDSATPTKGGGFESSSIQVHLGLNGSDWEDLGAGGTTCGSACTVGCPVTPPSSFYTSAMIGNFAIVAGDTDECLSCPSISGKSPAANVWSYSTSTAPVMRSVDTGLTAALYGTLKKIDFLPLWGFGIGVGAGAAGGADHDDVKNDAYFALITAPDPSKVFAPEDPTSSNTITYWQKPVAQAWPALNGAFIAAYNEAWAVGDGGAILHWKAPAITPAIIDMSMSRTQTGAWVQIVLSVTNTGGTVLQNLNTAITISAGSAALICGPICVTDYCSATPWCPTTLPPSGPAHFTWSYTLTGCYPVTFDGSASGDDLLTGSPVPTANDSTTITGPPLNFTIVKSQAPGTIGPTTPVTYTLVVTNTGATTIDTLVVVDTASPVLTSQTTGQPAAFGAPVITNAAGVGTRYVWSASGLNMTPGTFYTFAINGIVGNVCTPTTVNDTAYAIATSDCREERRLSNTTTFSIPAPPLSFTAAKERSGLLAVGSAVTYRVVVTNTSGATIKNMIVVDTIPSVLTGPPSTSQPVGFGPPTITSVPGTGTRYVWSSSFITLSPSASFTFSVTGTIGGVCTPTTATSRGSVSAGNQCGQAGVLTNWDAGTVSPQAIAIGITKIQALTPVFDIGATVTYTIVVENTGSATIKNLTIMDTVPSTVLVTATDEPAAFFPSGSVPVPGGVRYGWTAGGLSMSPGETMTFTVTGLAQAVLVPTTVSNDAYVWATADCATGQAGAAPVTFNLNPPVETALSVATIQTGVNSYRINVALTITSTGTPQIVQISGLTSRLNSLPAGATIITGPTPPIFQALMPGNRYVYSWEVDAVGPLPLTFGACTSATLVMTNVLTESCAVATVTTASSLLPGILTIDSIMACPNPLGLLDWHFTVILDVMNGSTITLDSVTADPFAILPPNTSLLTSPSPATITTPLAPGATLSSVPGGGRFTWTYLTTGSSATLFAFTQAAQGLAAGLTLYGTGTGVGGLGASSSPSLTASIATTSRWNASQGLVGRWEIDVVMTVNRTGPDPVGDVVPMPPTVAPAGRAWPMPVAAGTVLGARGWVSGTIFNPSWDGWMGPRPPGPAGPDIIKFAWTYSATGSVNLVFAGAVCANADRSGTPIPTYVIAYGAINLIDTGDVGMYVLNRNLMRGRAEKLTAAFNLKVGGPTSLIVYSSIGQKIRVLYQGDAVPRQDYEIIWNGTNNDGERVASGVYYLRLEGRRFVLTKKIALIK